MTANQAVFPIALMCAVFGVSRSGFYAWRDRRPSARRVADDALSDRVAAAHERSGGTYGAPRVHADLAAEGVRVGRKRVERLMKQAGLVGVSRRRSPRTTIRDARVRPASDLVDRNFFAEKPNQLWGEADRAGVQWTAAPPNDITYIPTWAGFLYLAVVLDAFSRRPPGLASLETAHRAVSSGRARTAPQGSVGPWASISRPNSCSTP